MFGWHRCAIVRHPANSLPPNVADASLERVEDCFDVYVSKKRAQICVGGGGIVIDTEISCCCSPTAPSPCL